MHKYTTEMIAVALTVAVVVALATDCSQSCFQWLLCSCSFCRPASRDGHGVKWLGEIPEKVGEGKVGGEKVGGEKVGEGKVGGEKVGGEKVGGGDKVVKECR